MSARVCARARAGGRGVSTGASENTQTPNVKNTPGGTISRCALFLSHRSCVTVTTVVFPLPAPRSTPLRRASTKTRHSPHQRVRASVALSPPPSPRAQKQLQSLGQPQFKDTQKTPGQHSACISEALAGLHHRVRTENPVTHDSHLAPTKLAAPHHGFAVAARQAKTIPHATNCGNLMVGTALLVLMMDWRMASRRRAMNASLLGPRPAPRPPRCCC